MSRGAHGVWRMGHSEERPPLRPCVLRPRSFTQGFAPGAGRFRSFAPHRSAVTGPFCGGQPGPDRPVRRRHVYLRRGDLWQTKRNSCVAKASQPPCLRAGNAEEYLLSEISSSPTAPSAECPSKGSRPRGYVKSFLRTSSRAAGPAPTLFSSKRGDRTRRREDSYGRVPSAAV